MQKLQNQLTADRAMTGSGIRLAAALAAIGTPQADHQPGICPLTDLGYYLVRVTYIISQFSRQMAAEDMVDYAQSVSSWLAENDDNSLTEYLEEKLDALM